MKAAVVPEHGRLELMEIADPRPGPYDCLVEIDACAICTGTDSNIIVGHFPFLVEPPFVLGHESTGLILSVGEKTRNFRVGQRVVRVAGIPIGQRVDGIGSNWGGFAELGLVRDDCAATEDGIESNVSGQSRVPLPEDVDVVSAALCINHREILSAALKLGVDESSRVIVIGSGYNGLLFSFFAKLLGAGRVVVVGNGARARLAADTFEADGFADYRDEPEVEAVPEMLAGEPTHLIDALGSVGSVAIAKSLLAPRTAFGRYGVHDYEQTRPTVEEIHRTHPALDVGTDEVGVMDRWYELWKRGTFDREGMCDGLAPLDEIVEAFGCLARREAVKLVVTM